MGRAYQIPFEPEVCDLALRIGAIDDARVYAQDLASAKFDQFGNPQARSILYFGNMLLGRIAIRSGDVAGAKQYLLASSSVTGVGTVRPNMSLAKDLLDAGETATVLQFFSAMKTQWPTGTASLDAWTQQVQAGLMPRFDAYLNLF